MIFKLVLISGLTVWSITDIVKLSLKDKEYTKKHVIGVGFELIVCAILWGCLL